MSAPGTGGAPKPRSSPLQVETFEGVPLGMITAVPKHEIPDGGAFYLQDVLVDLPGITRRRGPNTGVSGMVTFTNPIFGAASCFNPIGELKIGVIESNGSNAWLSVLSSNYGSKTQITLPTAFTTSPYPIVDVKSRLGGGALIGISSQYDENNPTQWQMVWRGGASPNYGTGTATVTRGSTAVTGSGTAWSTNASSGMFLLDAARNFVGVVKTVNSDTSITLENPALKTLSAAGYNLTSIRRVVPMAVVGEITCGTAAATVTGQNTKFKKQGLDSGTWDLFRQRDWAYIGTVSSVTDDTSLTLNANAAIACNVDNYIAVQEVDYTSSTLSVGFLNATYSQRQFYANVGGSGKSSYLWFSEENLPDGLDTSTEDGDFIPVSSGTVKSAQSPIKAIVPGFRSLLVLKDDETFALTGTQPENFTVDKVWSDGCLSGMSVQQWRSDVIFAGRNGIYVWDGTTVSDLTEKTLGIEYKAAVKNFDSTTYRMWSAVVRDHYVLFIENVSPRIGVTKGQTTTDPTRWTVVINMNTGAFTLWTNVDVRGAITLPSNQQQAVWVLVNTSSGGAVLDGNAFFDSTGNDTVTCAGNTVGPSFFMETKRYSLGDPLRRKLLKQVAMHYQSFGDGLTIDTVVGLGSVGTGSTNTSSFPQTSYTWTSLAQSYSTWTALGNAYGNWNAINTVVWGKKRYKFLKHDNFIGFRIYQNSTSNSVVQLGPWQLGYKVQAPGRI